MILVHKGWVIDFLIFRGKMKNENTPTAKGRYIYAGRHQKQKKYPQIQEQTGSSGNGGGDFAGGIFVAYRTGCQAWHFVVVDDPAVLQEIMKIHPYMGDAENSTDGHYCLRRHCFVFRPLDRRTARPRRENILLQAYELGLGTCWCGIEPNASRMEAFSKLR